MHSQHSGIPAVSVTVTLWTLLVLGTLAFPTTTDLAVTPKNEVQIYRNLTSEVDDLFTVLVSGSVGLAIWLNKIGPSVYKNAVEVCRMYDSQHWLATGPPCVGAAIGYASGLVAVVGSTIAFTSQILSFAGGATDVIQSLDHCEPGGAGCTRSDPLIEYRRHFEGLLRTLEPNHSVHDIFPDDSEVHGGITVMVHSGGRPTAKVSHNSTHHVIRVLDASKQKRGYLPTGGRYWVWGNGVQGIKAEGRHFNTPDNPPLYLTTVRDLFKDAVLDNVVRSDVVPYTACSKYIHKKIYDGKFIFESAPFSNNFERYETYPCPPFAIS